MAAESGLRLRFDAFELDEANARLLRAGTPLELPPKAFGVLCELARAPGRLVGKDALLDAVWGHRHVSESVLKSTVSQLRAVLGDDPKEPRLIETASRRGYRFIAALAGEAAPAPVPAMPAAAPSGLPSIVGRDDLLARLRAAWQAALSGKRQVVWVAGEAGIGKTTAIERFIAELGTAQVAHGQCVEQHGAGEPYLPVLDAVAALTQGDPALAALLRQVAPTWLLQLPWLSGESERVALGRELAGAGQQRMLRELGELLDRYTEQRPLLLVTEDLHWSDHATVQLIDHIARRRGPARLLWLGSFRPAEVIAAGHPLQALRHELKLHRLAAEISLDPFSEQEVSDYVGRRFPGRGLPESFMQALHARTDGLPMFVANLVDELASQGGLEADAADTALQRLRVPDSLAGVIEKQIARLAAEDRELLEAASVCGAEFSAHTLADTVQREPAWVGERCDALVRAQHWLRPLTVGWLGDGGIDARYAFQHTLYRHVLYQHVGAATRAQLHHRVALSMEGGDHAVAPAELALHFERSLDIAAALRHYAAAAESALRHFGPVEAMALTAHALALLPQVPAGDERDAAELELLGSRAVAASQVLGTVAPDTMAVFERAELLSERLPGRSRRALEMELGWVYQRRGEYARARAHAQRKADMARQRGDHLLFMSACNLMGATLFFVGELREARRWFEQGLAAFDALEGKVGDAAFVMDPAASLHARLARVLAHQGLVDTARAHAEQGLERARASGMPYGLKYALIQAGVVELRSGRPGRAMEHANALAALVAEHDIVEGGAFVGWLRGSALIDLGEFEDGIAHIERGHAELLHPGHAGAGCCAVLGQNALALWELGRHDAARARLAEALALCRRVGEQVHLPDLLMLQARFNGDGTALDEALQAARAQPSPWLELAVLVQRGGDAGALAQALGRVTEGGDTPLVVRARQMLAGSGT